MERIKVITQKRTTLKTQITNLSNIVAQNQVDSLNVVLRFKRVTELFHAYEELHDELAILDPENDKLNELDEIQNRYYELASKIETLQRPASSQSRDDLITMPVTNSVEKMRPIKLPVAELPKFNGAFEKWLSYKNSFITIIDSRTDIDDLQKFIYLKNSLEDDAADKISIYNISAENYKNAWNLLLESYEKKRILIGKHLDTILDYPAITKATPANLTKLVTDMRQHVNMLASLDVHPDQHLLTRIIERVLPDNTRSKWEENLKLDESPNIKKLYEFISETSFRLLTIKQNSSRSKTDLTTTRRRFDTDFSKHKFRKGEFGARVLVSLASSNCLACKTGKHPLYRCAEFKKWPVNHRWTLIKTNNICKNCLDIHEDRCKYPLCKECKKFHNILLHYFKSDSSQSNNERPKSGASACDKKSVPKSDA